MSSVNWDDGVFSSPLSPVPFDSNSYGVTKFSFLHFGVNSIQVVDFHQSFCGQELFLNRILFPLEYTKQIFEHDSLAQC